MASVSAIQVRAFVRETQDRYRSIDRADWDDERSCYRSPDTAKWQQAAAEAVPTYAKEWREIVRVLAQGESYYGGSY
jgi:hypothetical protein